MTWVREDWVEKMRGPLSNLYGDDTAALEAKLLQARVTSPNRMEHLDGVSWYDAVVPPWDHMCTAQTRAWTKYGLEYVERCACGATNLREPGEAPYWMERNQTRLGRGERAPVPAVLRLSWWRRLLHI